MSAPADVSATLVAVTDIHALAQACVKCGLCLPHCPTYRISGNEADSPRGRIALAEALAAGAELAADATLHLDQCLSCGVCERVCPSSVRYLDLLVATRQRGRAAVAESWRRRALRSLLQHPPRFARLIGVACYLPGRLGRALRRGRRPGPVAACPVLADATVAPKAILLLSGCTGAALETSVLQAAQSLLTQAGFAVQVAPAQCCGALARHSGATGAAAQSGQALRALVGQYRVAACTAVVAGCAGRYRDLLAAPGLPGYRDVWSLLAERMAHLRFRASTETVALHWPCTQVGDGAAINATRRLLAAVPGLRVVELPSQGRCCGGAGSWYLDHPELADALLQPALAELATIAPSRLLSSNIGCRLRLATALDLPVQHPLQLLLEQCQP
jgi:glycolate oxidase iron-sulfur subunit